MLSALVSPGAGHWYLGKKKSALLFLMAASPALFVLTSQAMSQANQIAEQILSGEQQLDAGNLLALITGPGSADASSKVAIATLWFTLVWAAAVFDAWRIGRMP